MREGWHGASRNAPCPICHHTDWCMATDDGAIAICNRIESEHPSKSGIGWVHKLGNREQGIGNREQGIGNRYGGFTSQRLNNSTPITYSLSPIPSSPDIAAYFAALPTAENDLQSRLCGYLERELGLPADILRALDWRWDNSEKVKAVAIPMRDAFGKVTGIRYRALKTGAKWAKRGSKDGLFFDPAFVPYDLEELTVCEGPTDQAAAQACGIWCVGRSSCGTGRDEIKTLVRYKGVKRVTIVADDDKPKPRPGGGTWQPGLDGALRLGEQLGIAYRIVLPPPGFKDLRDWYKDGSLNNVSFYRMAQGNAWHGPGRERSEK